MKSLYLRIWLTVVAALALFALASGWLVHRHVDQERAQFEAAVADKLATWGLMIQNSLPEADAPREQQAAALADWSRRLHVPLALDDADGQRIGASASFNRREQDPGAPHQAVSVRLDDGRTLWFMRPPRAVLGGKLGPGPALEGPGGLVGEPGNGRSAGPFGMPPPPDDAGIPPGPGPRGPGRFLPAWAESLSLLVLLALLFLAVAAGAYPVVRRLTRRLEALNQAVQVFGAGALDHRVRVEGRDEVAAVAASFNQAAGRIETLVRSHQSLLANASHELRSPLTRLKMAVAMMADAPPALLAELQTEIHTNIAELDALVEEVLLSSRLDSTAAGGPGLDPADDTVDLMAVAAEEAARVGAAVQGGPCLLRGNERLLRRALRNLLENARRYAGSGELTVELKSEQAVQQAAKNGSANSDSSLELAVCDRGPGVPEAERERIFEPFYRSRGHAEREGGVGLGLALVRQIAQRHDGSVYCEPREGGGSRFVISLPAARQVLLS